MAKNIRLARPARVALCALLALGQAHAVSQHNGSTTDSVGSLDQRFEVLVDGVAQDRLFAVDIVGERGIAVGGMGRVLITEDRGETWTLESPHTDQALLAVAMAGEHILAVGQSGVAFVRRWGQPWEAVATGTQERLLNVALHENGTAVAVGGFGTVLRSSDHGRSWQSAAPDWKAIAAARGGGDDRTGALSEPTMFATQILPNGEILIAGELAYILKATPHRAGWTLVHGGAKASGAIAPSLHDVAIGRDGSGFAVGQEGVILKTIDGGNSWQQKPTPSSGANLLAVERRDAKWVFALGMRTALYSRDGGESWQPLQALDVGLNWYSDIEAVSADGPLLAVGHSGRVIRIQ
ncbi:WD40/YVTN/BNR-like repeat-containing protein [Algiphilus sp.]|uniref:WD40/YVTN/BNR-like repeat-containing protein n=1 Tax=Algiphilus sp. TaxID=1872431 RepID=UPI003B523B8C